MSADFLLPMETKFTISYFQGKGASTPCFDGFWTIDEFVKMQTKIIHNEHFLRIWCDEDTEEERLVNIRDIRSIKVTYEENE